MSIEGLRHVPILRRTTVISAFSWTCWGLGGVAAVILFVATESLWGFAVVPLTLVIGMPIKDQQVPHQWAIRALRHRLKARRDNKRATAPLTRPKKGLSPWDDIYPVMAHVREKDGSISELPLRSTQQQTHLTVYLLLKGASRTWLESDAEGKFYEDLNFMDLVSRALSGTSEPDLTIVHTVYKRPSDKTLGYEYKGARVEEHALQGAHLGKADPESDIDDVDVTLGQNDMAQFETVQAQTGVMTNIAAIRMPWPKNRLGRKINPGDPNVFSKSKLQKTITKLGAAYGQCGISIELPTSHEVTCLFETALSLRQLDTRRLFHERDRALVESGAVEHIDDTPGADSDSWKPLSTRPSVRDGETPGHIVCDGTYIAAGYCTLLNVHSLAPGFQEGLVTSNDTYYSIANYCEAVLISREKFRAREHERWTMVAQGINPLNEHLSNDEADGKMAEIIDMRARLAESGQRAGVFYHLVTCVANSAEELEARWEDMTLELASIYELERVMWADEIADVVKASLAIRDK